MASDSITITIIKWEKHNPRKDVKKPSWFALSNRLIEDPDFYSFTGNEFKAWIYMLSQASQKQSPRFQINFEHADRACCISKKDFLSAIEKLKLIPSITVAVTSTLRECDANDTLHNNTLHNITEQRILAQSDSDESSFAEVILEFISIKEIILERKVNAKSQKAILEAFPDAPWVISEIRKMIAWEAANPSNKKKNFARFATNWLTRSWDKKGTQPKQHYVKPLSEINLDD